MKFKENLKYFIIIGIVFSVIYLFVAVTPLGKELVLRPSWTLSLSEIQIEENPQLSANTGNETLIPFILGRRLGYFTPEGRIAMMETFPYKASVSESLWTTYGSSASNTVLYAPDGGEACTVEDGGFVHLDDGRIYLFLPGGGGIAEYAEDGQRKWTYERFVPVTAFNSSPQGCVIGYADGNLAYLQPDGTELFSFYPGGSTYEVILGADISPSGKLTACVSGQEDQRFVLIRTTDGQSKIVFHEYLPGNLKRQTFVWFDANEEFVFYNFDGGLGIADCRTLESKKIPIDGTVVSIAESPGENLYLILSKNGSDYRISLLEKPDRLLGSVSFKAGNAFLTENGGRFFLGTDDYISCIGILRN